MDYGSPRHPRSLFLILSDDSNKGKSQKANEKFKNGSNTFREPLGELHGMMGTVLEWSDDGTMGAWEQLIR